MYQYKIKGVLRTCYTDIDIKRMEAEKRKKAEAHQRMIESVNKMRSDCARFTV